MAVAVGNLTVVEEGITSLHTYARIPMSLTVATRFRVDPLDNGLSGFSVQEEPVDPPYEKNYDDYDEERPTRWRQRWNISNWGVLAAYMGGQRVGGAVMAWNTAHVNMLEDRSDLTVLWDIRVAPDRRRTGVGRALFQQGELWARSRGCRLLKVETQNVNVPACRFYASNGCYLGAILLHAYPDLPDEVQMLWYKDLTTPDLSSDR